MNNLYSLTLQEIDSPASVARTEVGQRQFPNIPTFSGVPGARPNLWRAFCISVSAQTAVLLLTTGKTKTACILVSVALFFAAWQWTRMYPKQQWLLFVFAVLAVTIAFLPWFSGNLFGLLGTGNAVRTRPSRPLQSSGEQIRSSYVGIVLRPPYSKKKAEVIPPPSHTHSQGIWNTSKPMVIPFDGPYWYFKAPAKKPGLKARLVRGQPTLINIHSTDWQPLLMEAHQNLDSSINLDCCKEIDVTITNADNRPGRISIGVILTDSTSPDRPSQYLEEKPIVSSEASHFSMNRPPTEEKLRFQIVKGKLQTFDEITVAILPAKERSLGGAKVAIQQFTLIPR
jgi:hypothetical protein